MNGRFPYDLFFMIGTGFLVLATPWLLTPLFIPTHVHHHVAVIGALVLGTGLAITAVFVWMGRRRRGNT